MLLLDVRVLIVDDHEDTLECERVILEQAGAKVQCARSVPEAMECLAGGFIPQVLVTDIGLPMHDGFDLMRQVRALSGTLGKVPAIVFTAHAEERTVRRAIEAGFDMVMTKPANPLDIVRAVEEVARIAQERRGREQPETRGAE